MKRGLIQIWKYALISGTVLFFSISSLMAAFVISKGFFDWYIGVIPFLVTVVSIVLMCNIPFRRGETLLKGIELPVVLLVSVFKLLMIALLEQGISSQAIWFELIVAVIFGGGYQISNNKREPEKINGNIEPRSNSSGGETE